LGELRRTSELECSATTTRFTCGRTFRCPGQDVGQFGGGGNLARAPPNIGRFGHYYQIHLWPDIPMSGSRCRPIRRRRQSCASSAEHRNRNVRPLLPDPGCGRTFRCPVLDVGQIRRGGNLARAPSNIGMFGHYYQIQVVAGHSDVRVKMSANSAEAEILRELRRTSECSATNYQIHLWPDIPMSGSRCSPSRRRRKSCASSGRNSRRLPMQRYGKTFRPAEYAACRHQRENIATSE